jgi:hypothetical protein
VCQPQTVAQPTRDRAGHQLQDRAADRGGGSGASAAAARGGQLTGQATPNPETWVSMPPTPGRPGDQPVGHHGFGRELGPREPGTGTSRSGVTRRNRQRYGICWATGGDTILT